MKQTRSIMGGENNFSLERVCELDESGQIIRSWYEIFDPDGNLVGTFETIKEARRYIEDNSPSSPRPKF